jgi:tetratricopeptide (TPR) repeat protein
LLLASWLLPASARAESLSQMFAAANEAYFRGDFERAAEQYQRLLDAGVIDPDVCFNLATAEARLGQLGKAVLYFERTLWLDPSDELAQRELSQARAALGRKRAEREGEATVQARPPLSEALVGPLPIDGLAVLVLVLDVMLCTVLLLRRRARNESVRLGLAISAALVGLTLALAGFALYLKTDRTGDGRAAIVLRDGAELREGPEDSAQARAKAHEGQSGRISRREGSFVRVQLQGGEIGWMKSTDVAAIRPD